MTRVKVQAFEDALDAANNGDVFTRDKTHADGGAWQAPGAGSASAAWPVGSIFLSAVSTNPATLLGFGTWSAIGAGRVLIGIDAGDADFDTLGETGGAKTTSHTHPAGTLGTDTATGHGHNLAAYGTISAESSHTHGAGTLVPSAHSGAAVGDHEWDVDLLHQHLVGALAVGNHATHTHGVGTFAVGNHRHEMKEVFSHGHTIAAGAGAHAHPQHVRSNNTAGTAGSQGANAANTTYVGSTNTATLPAITVPNSGTSPAYTDYTAPTFTGSSGDESGTLAHTVTGPTGTVESTEDPIVHSVTQPSAHTMSGTSGAGSSHSHALGGTTDTGGNHSHAVNSGSTGSTASSTVQPYLVVAMWQRTA